MLFFLPPAVAALAANSFVQRNSFILAATGNS
jgi:hypothetical protein